MPLIKYASINFSAEKLELITKAVGIVNDYQAQGYDLTLRQVYYQFVARDWLPAKWADPDTGSTNNIKSYNNLKCLLGDARMAGVMDWEAMVDRTREMAGNTHWRSPASIVKAVSEQYMIDKWADQKYRPEVWVEKDALEGVVGTVCNRLDIPYFSCRGYTSLTSIWENAQRLKLLSQGGQTPIIFHLGDHDPSGIDMSRDIEERVRLFMDDQGAKLVFTRLALNMNQVEEYGPPENPAKATDSRYKSYKALHGDHSWELDALEPNVINAIITAAVRNIREDRKFSKLQARETKEKKLLGATSSRWSEVVEFIEGAE